MKAYIPRPKTAWRSVFLLTLVLIIALIVAACGPSTTPTPTSAPKSVEKPTEAKAQPTTPSKPAAKTTFRIAVGIDPDTLDPVASTTSTVMNMVEYVVQTLVRIDREGKVQPQLAESWEVSKDGLTVTFHLRKGVKFHDGTPFNAEAAKFNIERMLDPDLRVPIRAPFTSIESVEAVDEYTIRLHMKEPFPPLVSAFALTTAGMISPASVEKYGNSYKSIVHPVGTGPYVFKERVKGDHITVEKFADYWGEKPYYDVVKFQIVPEAATRESLLLAGQVDLIILPPASDLPALKQNPDVEVLLAPSDRTIFIAMNNLDPVLKDKRVRQALNYAVDKKAIIEKVLFGAGDIMDAPMAPSLFGYCKVGEYPYDPEKAKALLKEAGHETLELNFIAPTGRYVQDFQAAQAISGYLEEVGVHAPVKTMDWPSYVATITAPPEKNTTQLHYLGWAPSYLDAAQQMLQFLSTYAPPHGLETSFYKNEKVDELILKAKKETNPEVRKQLYCEASKIVWDDAPWIFLWIQRFPIVYSSKITGVSYLPTEMFDAIYAHPK